MPAAATPNDPAYVIWRRGRSRDAERALLLPHRAVVNFLSERSREDAGIAPTTCFSAVTSAVLRHRGARALPAAYRRAKVVIASRDMASDGAHCSRACVERCPRLRAATPSTWRLCSPARWSHSEPMRVLCGGEALHRLGARAHKRSPSVRNISPSPAGPTVFVDALARRAGRRADSSSQAPLAECRSLPFPGRRAADSTPPVSWGLFIGGAVS